MGFRAMVVGRRRIESTLAVLSSALLLAPAPARAQGAVSGRVTIQEKPKETTSDFANTVIYLSPRSGQATVVPMRTQVAINGRQFTPRVRVVPAGSSITYPNQDPFNHNVFSTPAAFDLGIYASGKSETAQFKKAGAYPVYCNIHEKMTAFVVVVTTPHFAQASADGRWSIPRVPAGKYDLHVWHERATEVVKEIDVPAAGVTDLETRLDASGFKLVAHKNKLGKDYAAAGVRY